VDSQALSDPVGKMQSIKRIKRSYKDSGGKTFEGKQCGNKKKKERKI